ncbi:hypothetical protein EAG_00934 [Camponotus floridanus]|uniref:Uncharacterized protein n=1 Tax=Camponotus floridanus TaxID=104421 RepID=E2AGN5_CAMFO|nr:hypothetical protein EAG_00934 [Camponotus floridanus]
MESSNRYSVSSTNDNMAYLLTGNAGPKCIQMNIPTSGSVAMDIEMAIQASCRIYIGRIQRTQKFSNITRFSDVIRR